MSPAAVPDLHKRRGAQFFQGQPSQRGYFLVPDGPALQRAQEVVQQPLPDGSIVKTWPTRGLRGLLDEVAKPFGSRGQTFQEESV